MPRRNRHQRGTTATPTPTPARPRRFTISQPPTSIAISSLRPARGNAASIRRRDVEPVQLGIRRSAFENDGQPVERLGDVFPRWPLLLRDLLHHLRHGR
jgi:hypothetical protein